MWDVLWCRFLRARKFDVPKAKAMLLSAEQWRKDEKVDELARCVIFFLSFLIFSCRTTTNTFCHVSVVVC
jgi:hypothetical protein